VLALLGELRTESGCVMHSGVRTVAYVPQSPTIFSGSVRDNIVFGRPLDLARYAEVLRVCCLASEVQGMAAGDDTVLTARGAELSGGQVSKPVVDVCLPEHGRVYEVTGGVSECCTGFVSLSDGRRAWYL
jgi:hypothetical protein